MKTLKLRMVREFFMGYKSAQRLKIQYYMGTYNGYI